MQILVRPVLVVLLIACHLGIPGRATAEFSPPIPPVEQRAIPEGPVEPGPWRLESALGLAGDLDPASVPVKQTDLVDSSVPPLDPGPFSAMPAPAAPSPEIVAAPVPVPESSKSGRQKYEVEDNHHVRQFIDQFQTGYRRAVVETWLLRS